MSFRSDAAICRYCGLVELAARMVRIEDGDYVYTCQPCAVGQRVPVVDATSPPARGPPA
ncbi:MAG TPA: hypothetical protein VFH78_00550 [Candidatus Thermoplasmatota archaeon]|nr:hypothetical protein [Candidatus Thermoplasmatota archaeon]